uniref:Uncharacterized protein n=1 Tax=Chryseobacterium endophyticum TaxID=1854762 RepID=A0AAU6WTE7_9FLAO
MDKAKILLEEKMKNLAYFSEDDFTNATKNVNDGFRMLLPTEIYKSYEAYNSSSLALTRFANVNPAVKSVTMYYQPVPDKEFDFVINPVVHEPVIQILYEIKLSIKRNPERKIAAELKASKKEKSVSGCFKNMLMKDFNFRSKILILIEIPLTVNRLALSTFV